MKNIIFYGRTQVGTAVLSYLVAQGFDVKVIPEDDMTRNLVKLYKLKEVTLEEMGEFDLFICCHGSKIIPEQYLTPGKFINMHSCLWKYKGKDPITRYIENGDTEASIESHYMVKNVDAGEVIERVLFTTPVVKTHGEYFNIALPYYYECIDKTLRKLNWGRSAAMTRYQDNGDLFRFWVSYYSKYFDDIYVFGCNTDDSEIVELIQEYKVNYIPILTDIYSEGTHNRVFDLQSELFKTHEWVFYSDMDEIVVPDPARYKDLTDFMRLTREKQTFCEGFEVIMENGDAYFDWFKPCTTQRRLWVKDPTGSYSKPCLSRIKTNWREGFHTIHEMVEQQDAQYIKDTGLYLFHLKNINSLYPSERSSKEPILKIPEKFKGTF